MNELFSLKFEALQSIETSATTYQYVRCRVLGETSLHLSNSYSLFRTKLIRVIAIHLYDAVRIK